MVTKAKLIAICERAKKGHLWDGRGKVEGKEVWTCSALHEASKAEGMHTTPIELRNLVKSHIQGHIFMDGLLSEKFGWTAYRKMTKAQVQAWRFLMLDNMIKMLSKGGKGS
jgi:hypothetical protein